MTELPGFAALLARLLDHRGPEPAESARRAGVTDAELAAVLDGAAPDPALLRRLAPALGLDTADLFEIAALPLPADLAPAGGMATTSIVGVVRFGMALPADRRAELRSFVASLPPADRPGRIEGLPASAPDPASAGNLLMRMVATRNLGWTGTTKIFHLLTGRYWMSDAYGRISSGADAPAPDLVADFALVLGIPAGDLAALLGMPLPPELPGPDAAVADAALLLRGLRRLGVAQLREAEDLARALQPS
ncbi:hypothetical protein OG618_33675 [Kitasatospora sp. NBC_01246]|uniref:hypothetical protein n=1 Tax=Kitasatospora sp. NBC_01246 TaxID=2903570 RepID=UPI002E324FCB|nr:hypothetical protein [Kitasatospora sp. NBC_01246]